MQEISEQKKKFLNSIGIDINNLPLEFQRYSDRFENVFSKEEIDFLSDPYVTGTYSKTFCMKDIVGTIHPDYTDKTWVEAFLQSKRGDRVIEQYFNNPEYYSVDLKKKEQNDLRHDSPIELYESDGQFVITGGNNRMNLMMMKYLAEISQAQTQAEKAKINEEYTFVGQVQSTPGDKDIMYMINMIKENYGNDVLIRRTAENHMDCQYTIQIGEELTEITSKEDFYKILRDSYKLENLGQTYDLQDNLTYLMQDRTAYKSRKDSSRARILDNAYPELEKIQELISKLRKYRIENNLYKGVDLKNISLTDLCNKAAHLIEEQEKQSTPIQDNEEDIERKSQIKGKKEYSQKKTVSVVDSVDDIYDKLKKEEMKFSEIAEDIGINYSKTSTDDVNIHDTIEGIKENFENICQKIQQIDDIEQLDRIGNNLEEIESLTKNNSCITDGISKMKEDFQKGFHEKIEELLKNSKISKLQQEKMQIESKKIGIIGKMLGKGRLQQAKIKNIDLQKDLILSERPSEKTDYSLEDSLSELFSYVQCELGNVKTPEMKEFLKKVNENPQLLEMIDKESLDMLTKQKVLTEQNKNKLPTVVGHNKSSTRKQVQLIQGQNEDMEQQIQDNKNNIEKDQFKSQLRVSGKHSSQFEKVIGQILRGTQELTHGDKEKAQIESETQSFEK